MPPRILVPFDDSEPARDALEYATDLFPDGEFVALTVLDTSSVPFIPNPADGPGSAEEIREQFGDASDRLEPATVIADERGIDLETRTRVGSPAQEIVEVVESESIDHVVIGSHGRAGVTRILLGSVAEVVVRHSPVPVTVVR